MVPNLFVKSSCVSNETFQTRSTVVLNVVLYNEIDWTSSDSFVGVATSKCNRNVFIINVTSCIIRRKKCCFDNSFRFTRM